jgi:hypothetical protein
MSTLPQNNKRNILDYLLYILAGAVVSTLCFTALLWASF